MVSVKEVLKTFWAINLLRETLYKQIKYNHLLQMDVSQALISCTHIRTGHGTQYDTVIPPLAFSPSHCSRLFRYVGGTHADLQVHLDGVLPWWKAWQLRWWIARDSLQHLPCWRDMERDPVRGEALGCLVVEAQ